MQGEFSRLEEELHKFKSQSQITDNERCPTISVFFSQGWEARMQTARTLTRETARFSSRRSKICRGTRITRKMVSCPQISTLTGCWISYSRSGERSAFSCRNRGTISGSRAPTDAPALTRLDIFQKRIGDVGSAIVRDAGRLAFDILHQPIEIIPGIGNADHAYGRTIP